MKYLSLIAPLAAAATSTLFSSNDQPIILSRTGGFSTPGLTLHHPTNPDLTLSCDHGYMEYFMPVRPRATSVVLWHSSSTQSFQNRWDNGPGFKDLLLRHHYPVYLWDGPRVGRANYPCEVTSFKPSYRDQDNFRAWNFGPRNGVWWDNVQFPKDDAGAWERAARARYVEYDTRENVELQARAAARAADSNMVGDSIVYVTNSAAGLRAQLATSMANASHIRGIIAYESIGYVYPSSANMSAGPGGFGPVVVPDERFQKLAELDGVWFVWGDNRARNSTFVRESERVAGLINGLGGKAEVVMLGNGNTHLPFADLNNDEVLKKMIGWLEGVGLGDYAE